jgi:hypothetical protein
MKGQLYVRQLIVWTGSNQNKDTEILLVASDKKRDAEEIKRFGFSNSDLYCRHVAWGDFYIGGKLHVKAIHKRDLKGAKRITPQDLPLYIHLKNKNPLFFKLLKRVA